MHPSADRSGRFPVDAALRAKGWRIRARHRGMVFWQRGSHILAYAAAVKTLSNRELQAAVRQRDQYFAEVYR